MNRELQQKLETIISPRLLLEKIDTTPYGVAFVAWGVYNRIGQNILEEEMRVTAELFIREHKSCIKLAEQAINSARASDPVSFCVFLNELFAHPDCVGILEQMFLGGAL